jgi:hypothetical protein
MASGDAMANGPKFTNLSAALAVASVAAGMKKAELYWRKAKECDERAQQTKDQWVRQQFQRSAEEWQRAAHRATQATPSPRNE